MRTCLLRAITRPCLQRALRSPIDIIGPRDIVYRDPRGAAAGVGHDGHRFGIAEVAAVGMAWMPAGPPSGLPTEGPHEPFPVEGEVDQS